MSTPYPKRADHFREWSKLMLEQAIVPDRVQYKRNGTGTSLPQAFKRKRKRKSRRKFRRKRRSMKGD